MNCIVMTVRGRKDLTRDCLQTMNLTLGDSYVLLVLVDAGEQEEKLDRQGDVRRFIAGGHVTDTYLHEPGCGISEGWNLGIEHIRRVWGGEDDKYIWLLNNDVVFIRRGWLDALQGRLDVPGTGLVGSSAMSVFGWPFATGGIWGFRLAEAVRLAENGKILDEKLNLSLQDVDLSVRFKKAGYTVTHVQGVELGPDPMLRHLISQTVYSRHGERAVYKMREPERRYFIDKHGRKDGKEGYEGVVEIQ